MFRSIAHWLGKSNPDLPQSVQRQLLTYSLAKKRTLVFSMIASLTIALAAALMTQALWAYAWLALEIIFASGRWVNIARFEKLERCGAQGDAENLLVFSLAWMASLAIGFVLCVMTGNLPLILMIGIAASALIGGLSSRNAGTPRYAIICIVLMAAPYSVALAMSPLPYAMVIPLPIILGMIGMISVLGENHAVLVELYTAQHENARLAHSDPLTGLSNRTREREQLSKFLDEAKSGVGIAGQLQVLYLDLDGFKQVNDHWGHAAGDRALQVVAERLRKNVRERDVVARIGGDEFVVILPRTDVDEAAQISRRIIEQISCPYEIGLSKPIRLGVSIGAASFPIDGRTPDELLASADAALYAAKREGAGRYVQASRHVERGNEATLAPAIAQMRLRAGVTPGRS